MERSESDGAKKAGRGGSGNDGEGKVEKEIKVEGSSEERQKYAKPQYRRRQESGRPGDIQKGRLTCFGCGSRRYYSTIRIHPLLDVPMCVKCMEIYKTGSFDKDEEGHELYCRMCGNGGDIFWCDEEDPRTKQPCPYSFCVSCIERHFGAAEVARLEKPSEKFTCWICDDGPVEKLRMRIPGYVAGSRMIFTNEILRLLNRSRTAGGRASMTPQSRNKRSRPSNDQETGKRCKRHSLASSSTSASQGKRDKGAGEMEKQEEKTKAIPAESRQVFTQASERCALKPFTLEGTGKVPERSLTSMTPAPIKSEPAPFCVESTAAPKDIVSPSAELAPMLNESVMTMTASEWKLAEPVSRYAKPMSRWLKSPPFFTTSARLPAGPTPLLNSTESAAVSTLLKPTSTESAAVSRKIRLMSSGSSPLRGKSAPTAPYSGSPTKSALYRMRAESESESASSILASIWTDSEPAETPVESNSIAATKTGQELVSNKSASIHTKSIQKSVESAPKSASVSTKSAPTSIGSAPTSAKPSPKLTESACVSTDPLPISTESAPVPTKSLPKTLGSAPEPMESAANTAKSPVQGVELPSSDRADVKSVGSVVDGCSPTGGAETTDCARDDIDKRAACAALHRPLTSRVPEESRGNRDAPLRQVFTRRLPPGPGRGATLLDPSFEISWGASGTLLRGFTSSIDGRDAMEFVSYSYSLENGNGSISSDSEEEGSWEVLSTDSSDNDFDRSDGDLGLDRRLVSRRGYQSKVFEWDSRFARRGGMIEDLSGGMEKNVSIQVCNTVDSEQLPYFKYVTGYVMGDGVQQKTNPDTMVCCDCTDGCRDPNLCACLQVQAHDDGSYANVNVDGGVVPRGLRGIASSPESRGDGKGGKGSGEEGGAGRSYSDDGLLLRERRTIFECHSRCACNPETCKNRVVSRGVHLRLQVFRCDEPEKGWGLRCLDTIPAGTFVACYLGEVLRERDVDEHGKLNGDDYLFGLDFGKRQSTFHGASHGQVMSPFSVKPWSPSGFEANGEESLVCRSPVGGSAWDRRREGASATASGVLATVDGCQVVDLCDSHSDEGSGQGSQCAVAWNRPKIGKSSCRDAGGSSATRVNEEALAMFMEVTGERNRQKALFFFRGAGEHTEVAINHYFAFDHSKSSVFPMGDDSTSVTEDDVQVVSGGERGVADARGSLKNGVDAKEVDTVERGNRDSGEFQRREPEEKGKEGAHKHAFVERRVIDNVADGTTATGLDSPGGAGSRRMADDRDPCCLDGGASNVDKAGGIIGKAENGCGSHGEASVNPLYRANGDVSTDGYPGAENGEVEVVRGSPQRKPAQALAGSDRNPQLFPSLEASKSDHSPRKELKKGRGGGDWALGGNGSPVDGMGTVDKALSSSVMSSANGERSLPAAVSSPSQAATAGGSAACASPQGARKRSLMMASAPPHPSNGVANVVSTKPSQPMPRSSPLGVKDPVHPQTPPRKATSPTPGGVTTPNSTFERHDSPSVASPKKALSTPETAPPLANKESAVESPVERVSGSTSNGAKPCGVDPGGSSRGATKDYLGESAGTPDSAARGHGHATSPEALVVDAKAYGNVARFMNHSCAGNLNKHMVFVESHDVRMPRVAFFAPQIIQPMEELTYDYGYVVGAVEGKSLSCHCGASSCPGRLL